MSPTASHPDSASSGSATRDAASGRVRLAEARISHDFGLLLSLAAADAVGRMMTALAPYGIGPRPFTILAIASDGLGPTQRELADFLRIDPSQIVSAIDDLERRGLVERRVSATDRRANVIVATTEGRELMSRALDVVRDANRTSLSPEREARLRELLDDVVYGASGA